MNKKKKSVSRRRTSVLSLRENVLVNSLNNSGNSALDNSKTENILKRSSSVNDAIRDVPGWWRKVNFRQSARYSQRFSVETNAGILERDSTTPNQSDLTERWWEYLPPSANQYKNLQISGNEGTETSEIIVSIRESNSLNKSPEITESPEANPGPSHQKPRTIPRRFSNVFSEDQPAVVLPQPKPQVLEIVDDDASDKFEEDALVKVTKKPPPHLNRFSNAFSTINDDVQQQVTHLVPEDNHSVLSRSIESVENLRQKSRKTNKARFSEAFHSNPLNIEIIDNVAVIERPRFSEAFKSSTIQTNVTDSMSKFSEPTTNIDKNKQRQRFSEAFKSSTIQTNVTGDEVEKNKQKLRFSEAFKSSTIQTNVTDDADKEVEKNKQKKFRFSEAFKTNSVQESDKSIESVTSEPKKSENVQAKNRFSALFDLADSDTEKKIPEIRLSQSMMQGDRKEKPKTKLISLEKEWESSSSDVSTNKQKDKQTSYLHSTRVQEIGDDMSSRIEGFSDISSVTGDLVAMETRRNALLTPRESMKLRSGRNRKRLEEDGQSTPRTEAVPAEEGNREILPEKKLQAVEETVPESATSRRSIKKRKSALIEEINVPDTIVEQSEEKVNVPEKETTESRKRRGRKKMKISHVEESEPVQLVPYTDTSPRRSPRKSQSERFDKNKHSQVDVQKNKSEIYSEKNIPSQSSSNDRPSQTVPRKSIMKSIRRSSQQENTENEMLEDNNVQSEITPRKSGTKVCFQDVFENSLSQKNVPVESSEPAEEITPRKSARRSGTKVSSQDISTKKHLQKNVPIESSQKNEPAEITPRKSTRRSGTKVSSQDISSRTHSQKNIPDESSEEIEPAEITPRKSARRSETKAFSQDISTKKHSQKNVPIESSQEDEPIAKITPRKSPRSGTKESSQDISPKKHLQKNVPIESSQENEPSDVTTPRKSTRSGTKVSSQDISSRTHSQKNIRDESSEDNEPAEITPRKSTTKVSSQDISSKKHLQKIVPIESSQEDEPKTETTTPRKSTRRSGTKASSKDISNRKRSQKNIPDESSEENEAPEVISPRKSRIKKSSQDISNRKRSQKNIPDESSEENDLPEVISPRKSARKSVTKASAKQEPVQDFSNKKNLQKNIQDKSFEDNEPPEIISPRKSARSGAKVSSQDISNRKHLQKTVPIESSQKDEPIAEITPRKSARSVTKVSSQDILTKKHLQKTVPIESSEENEPAEITPRKSGTKVSSQDIPTKKHSQKNRIDSSQEDEPLAEITPRKSARSVTKVLSQDISTKKHSQKNVPIDSSQEDEPLAEITPRKSARSVTKVLSQDISTKKHSQKNVPIDSSQEDEPIAEITPRKSARSGTKVSSQDISTKKHSQKNVPIDSSQEDEPIAEITPRKSARSGTKVSSQDIPTKKHLQKTVPIESSEENEPAEITPRKSGTKVSSQDISNRKYSQKNILDESSEENELPEVISPRKFTRRSGTKVFSQDISTKKHSQKNVPIDSSQEDEPLAEITPRKSARSVTKVLSQDISTKKRSQKNVPIDSSQEDEPLAEITPRKSARSVTKVLSQDISTKKHSQKNIPIDSSQEDEPIAEITPRKSARSVTKVSSQDIPIKKHLQKNVPIESSQEGEPIAEITPRKSARSVTKVSSQDILTKKHLQKTVPIESSEDNEPAEITPRKSRTKVSSQDISSRKHSQKNILDESSEENELEVISSRKSRTKVSSKDISSRKHSQKNILDDSSEENEPEVISSRKSARKSGTKASGKQEPVHEISNKKELQKTAPIESPEVNESTDEIFPKKSTRTTATQNIFKKIPEQKNTQIENPIEFNLRKSPRKSQAKKFENYEYTQDISQKNTPIETTTHLNPIVIIKSSNINIAEHTEDMNIKYETVPTPKIAPKKPGRKPKSKITDTVQTSQNQNTPSKQSEKRPLTRSQTKKNDPHEDSSSDNEVFLPEKTTTDSAIRKLTFINDSSDNMNLTEPIGRIIERKSLKFSAKKSIQNMKSIGSTSMSLTENIGNIIATHELATEPEDRRTSKKRQRTRRESSDSEPDKISPLKQPSIKNRPRQGSINSEVWSNVTVDLSIDNILIQNQSFDHIESSGQTITKKQNTSSEIRPIESITVKSTSSLKTVSSTSQKAKSSLFASKGQVVLSSSDSEVETGKLVPVVQNKKLDTSKSTSTLKGVSSTSQNAKSSMFVSKGQVEWSSSDSEVEKGKLVPVVQNKKLDTSKSTSNLKVVGSTSQNAKSSVFASKVQVEWSSSDSEVETGKLVPVVQNKKLDTPKSTSNLKGVSSTSQNAKSSVFASKVQVEWSSSDSEVETGKLVPVVQNKKLDTSKSTSSLKAVGSTSQKAKSSVSASRGQVEWSSSDSEVDKGKLIPVVQNKKLDTSKLTSSLKGVSSTSQKAKSSVSASRGQVEWSSSDSEVDKGKLIPVVQNKKLDTSKLTSSLKAVGSTSQKAKSSVSASRGQVEWSSSDSEVDKGKLIPVVQNKKLDTSKSTSSLKAVGSTSQKAKSSVSASRGQVEWSSSDSEVDKGKLIPVVQNKKLDTSKLTSSLKGVSSTSQNAKSSVFASRVQVEWSSSDSEVETGKLVPVVQNKKLDTSHGSVKRVFRSTLDNKVEMITYTQDSKVGKKILQSEIIDFNENIETNELDQSVEQTIAKKQSLKKKESIPQVKKNVSAKFVSRIHTESSSSDREDETGKIQKKKLGYESRTVVKESHVGKSEVRIDDGLNQPGTSTMTQNKMKSGQTLRQWFLSQPKAKNEKKMIEEIEKEAEENKRLREIRREKERKERESNRIGMFYLRKIPSPQPIVKPKPKKVQTPEEIERLVERRKAMMIHGKVYRKPRIKAREPWIRVMYKRVLVKKMEPKYGYDTRSKIEEFLKDVRETVGIVTRRKTYQKDAVESLKLQMARHGLIKTNYEFYEFVRENFPYDFRMKVIPCSSLGGNEFVPFNNDDENRLFDEIQV